MDKKLISTSGLVVAAVLFVAINVVAGNTLRSVRWDMTEDKLYTLSDGTRNILADLEDPITLRFYFSKSLVEDIPQLQMYAQRIEEMLEEYAATSSQIRVEVIEPEAFSEAEDDAVGYGLRGAPINTAGDRVYMGVAGTNSVDDVETIPWFDFRREEFLEYDLSELVYNLATFDKPVVGIMSPLPLRGTTPNPMQQRPQPLAIVSTLEQLFEIRWLPPTTEEIPEEVTTLMLVHPKDLAPRVKFAIDQFVLGGGKLIAFVDPFCEIEELPLEAQQNPMAARKDSQINDLFGAWGLTMESGKLAGCMDTAQVVRLRDGSSPFPVWMNPRADNLNREDFVSAELNSVILHSAGILKPTEGAETSFEPLITTSANAMPIESMMMQFGPDPRRMVDDFVPLGEPLTLAARIHGPAKTAFPGGKPAAEPLPGEEPAPEEDAGEVLTESVEPINVIAVADADFLHDNTWASISDFLGVPIIRPLADNGTFATNCLENLSGSNDLISLRSRGSFHRPFDKKRELEQEADARFRDKEQELQAKLEATEQKLNELQQGKDDASAMILSPEQAAALENFREEQVATRKELREVRHGLAKDIESLGSVLKFVNILLVPLVIAIGGLGVFFFRGKKRD